MRPRSRGARRRWHPRGRRRPRPNVCGEHRAAASPRVRRHRTAAARGRRRCARACRDRAGRRHPRGSRRAAAGGIIRGPRMPRSRLGPLWRVLRRFALWAPFDSLTRQRRRSPPFPARFRPRCAAWPALEGVGARFFGGRYGRRRRARRSVRYVRPGGRSDRRQRRRCSRASPARASRLRRACAFHVSGAVSGSAVFCWPIWRTVSGADRLGHRGHVRRRHAGVERPPSSAGRRPCRARAARH